MRTLTIESKAHGTHHVLLDDEDYDRVVAEGKWHIHKAPRREVFYVRSGKSILLHRFIMDAPRGKMVDHANGDGRDNRKENLRICTRAENNRNSNVPPRGKVPYHGVKLRADVGFTKRYVAEIHANRHIKMHKVRRSRYFYTAEEAAVEYDKLARKYHGEFATLNFPDGVPPHVMQRIAAGQKEYEEIVNCRAAEKQSKQTGVSWSKHHNRWRAKLNRGHLGYFKTEEEAIAARLRAEREVAEDNK